MSILSCRPDSATSGFRKASSCWLITAASNGLGIGSLLGGAGLIDEVLLADLYDIPRQPVEYQSAGNIVEHHTHHDRHEHHHLLLHRVAAHLRGQLLQEQNADDHQDRQQME